VVPWWEPSGRGTVGLRFGGFFEVSHSLYKYYDNREWAEAFLNGELRFRSLSYFQDYEDAQIRGDQNEGTSIYRPTDGLVITNHTRGWIKVFPGRFQAIANQEEIFIFCLSRSLNSTIRKRFKAVVCIEIFNIKTFCARVESALPPAATLPGKPGRMRIGQQVEYYCETDNCTPRWALPDLIAASKLNTFSWQDEYRLMFCLTDALGFERAEMYLVGDGSTGPQKVTEHRHYDVKAGSLRDLCRLHEFQLGNHLSAQSEDRLPTK
jgi:hypothetical protein